MSKEALISNKGDKAKVSDGTGVDVSVSFGGETVVLKNKDESPYKASGWPYESQNPEYPLQTPEEAKKANTLLTDHTEFKEVPSLKDVETAEKTLKWDSAHNYTKSDFPVSCYRYFIILKLQEKEKPDTNSLNQFVAAVPNEWMAQDLCNKFNSQVNKYSVYQKFVYEKVYVEGD